MLKPYRHFGKSIYDFFAVKEKFFQTNDSLVKDSEKIGLIYKKQKLRTVCKICNYPLPPHENNNAFFINRGTLFFRCCQCGHINGEFDDGKEYAEILYSDKTDDLYGSEYREPSVVDYTRRMDSIYIPKARFLIDVLIKMNMDYKSFQFLDIGAGAGYMVGALERFGVDVMGLEVDKNQVIYANKMLKGSKLLHIGIDDVCNNIMNTKAKVLVFIYFCVPKLSLTCAFEIIFPDVWARHIGGGGGHTHLFTKSSLAWICEHYHFDQIATWDFGTDIMDLYRSLVVLLKKSKASDEFIKEISDLFIENTDAMQQIIDKTELASDTHVLLKNNAI